MTSTGGVATPGADVVTPGAGLATRLRATAGRFATDDAAGAAIAIADYTVLI